MNNADNSRIPVSPFHEELWYVPTEQAFEMIGGQSVINRYKMYDHEGKPSMVNTALVMNAIVFYRNMRHDYHSKLLLANHGWEISIDHFTPPDYVETALAHALGHLIVMKYDIQHNKELYPLGVEYSASNFMVEDLCDYIGDRLLENIDKD